MLRPIPPPPPPRRPPIFPPPPPPPPKKAVIVRHRETDLSSGVATTVNSCSQRRQSESFLQCKSREHQGVMENMSVENHCSINDELLASLKLSSRKIESSNIILHDSNVKDGKSKTGSQFFSLGNVPQMCHTTDCVRKKTDGVQDIMEIAQLLDMQSSSIGDAVKKDIRGVKSYEAKGVCRNENKPSNAYATANSRKEPAKSSIARSNIFSNSYQGQLSSHTNKAASFGYMHETCDHKEYTFSQSDGNLPYISLQKSTEETYASASSGTMKIPPPPLQKKNFSCSTQQKKSSNGMRNIENTNILADPEILAMANRLSNSNEIEDPSIIEGAFDPQYWKRVRGRSKSRERMRGKGAVVKTQSKGDVYQCRNTQKTSNGKLSASQRRQIDHQKKKQIRMQERSKNCELLEALTSNPDVDRCKPHQPLQHSQKGQLLIMSNSLEHQIGMPHSKQGRKGTSTKNTASNITNTGPLEITLVSMSDSRSTKSNRSNRSATSNNSKRSSRSKSSIKSILSFTSKKSARSRLSLIFPFGKASKEKFSGRSQSYETHRYSTCSHAHSAERNYSPSHHLEQNYNGVCGSGSTLSGPMYSTTSNFYKPCIPAEIIESISFDYESLSNSSISLSEGDRYYDDISINARPIQLSVTEAVDHFNKQNKIEKIASAARGVLSKIRTK